MKNIIRVDLENRNDLLEKYNKNIVSRDLINYIIDNVPVFAKNETLTIVINSRIDNQKECISLIKKGLQEEYDKNVFLYRQNNLKQIVFLLIGILILLISTVVDGMVFKELASVGVWVMFWNMIETELFEDRNIKIKKKKLKRLLSSEIVVNCIEDK